ncbi:hypothetical protein ACFQOY_13865 [Enterococcus alcedinis]|uniref:Uncharacterized protein n=1 Tax=Enterococcus alcedinis TaxID=1274384 RepID=A0A917JFI1_9ENTE|nr:hypothetical protein [Enterococcus alcedinis]MBP2100996.1 hypothetical protein [Enterococcus alcedinis]GGI64706.1 hypothetical protein GCM10011482_03600 [Enterococcus alcedinis]
MNTTTHLDEIFFNTLSIPDNTQYWLCRADGGKYYEDFHRNNFIAVENDGINIDLLHDIEAKYQDTDEEEKSKLILSSYKTAYVSSQFYLDVLNELNKEKPDEFDKNVTRYKTKASITATRNFNFVYNMKIGDFVIVPGIRSQQYLIGIIVSEEFDSDIDRLTEAVTLLCPSSFKRKVHWIREIPKITLPNSLSWGLHAQKTIYDITAHAEDINKLVATSYIYNDKFYHQLLVNTPDPITSYQWFQFQRAIFEVAEDKSKEIFIKTNVQSPGVIEFVTNPDNLPIILVGIGVLFGDVDTSAIGINVKFKGLIPFFLPSERAKRIAQKIEQKLIAKKSEAQLKNVEQLAELELEKAKTENDIAKAELHALQLKNKQTQLELDDAQKQSDDEKEKELFHETVQKIEIQDGEYKLPTFDENQHESIKQLQVEDPSVHFEKTHETRMDSDD